jgi:hypothetical protein
MPLADLIHSAWWRLDATGSAPVPALLASGRAWALGSLASRLGGGLRGPGQLHAAQPRSDERQKSDSDLLAGGGVGDPFDETSVEGAHDGSIGIVWVDAERTVPNVHSRPVVLLHGRHRSEGETLEGVDHLVDGLLEGRVPKGTGHLPTPSGAFRLGVLGGFVTVGVSDEGDEGADEESQLGIAAEEGLAEPVTLGWAAPPGGRAWLLIEDAGFEESFEVGADRGGMHAEDAGEFWNLPRSFLEGLHNGQPADVTEQLVALGPHGVSETSIHLDDPHGGTCRLTNVQNAHGYEDTCRRPFRPVAVASRQGRVTEL